MKLCGFSVSFVYDPRLALVVVLVSKTSECSGQRLTQSLLTG